MARINGCTWIRLITRKPDGSTDTKLCGEPRLKGKMLCEFHQEKADEQAANEDKDEASEIFD